MGEENIIKNAWDILSKKDLVVEQILEAKILLDGIDLDSTQDERVFFLQGLADYQFGRLFFEQQDIETAQRYFGLARIHFNKCMEMSPKFSKAHLYLVRMDIMESNYESAKNHLSSYQDSIEVSDFSLMCELLGETKEAHMIDGCIQDVMVEYEPLMLNYRLAHQAAIDGDYTACTKHIIVCDTLAKRKKLPIDFTATKVLATRLSKEHKRKKDIELAHAYHSEVNVGSKMLLAQKMISNDPENPDVYFFLIDAYLALKVHNIIPEILETVKKLNLSESAREKVANYEKLYFEWELYYKNQDKIDATISMGDHAIKEGELGISHAIFDKSYEHYRYPLFLLKKAEICYVCGDFSNAISYTLKYLSRGHRYYKEAMELLYRSYRRLGRTDLATQILEDKYDSLAIDGIDLEGWMFLLDKRYQQDIGNINKCKVKRQD